MTHASISLLVLSNDENECLVWGDWWGNITKAVDTRTVKVDCITCCMLSDRAMDELEMDVYKDGADPQAFYTCDETSCLMCVLCSVKYHKNLLAPSDSHLTRLL